MKRVPKPKGPDYLKTEGTLVGQCPECRDVLIKYAGDQYGPRVQQSMVLFGKGIKKVLCHKCVARLQI